MSNHTVTVAVNKSNKKQKSISFYNQPFYWQEDAFVDYCGPLHLNHFNTINNINQFHIILNYISQH